MQLLEEYKSDMRKLKTLLERGVGYRTVAAILAQSQYILKDYPGERKYCFAYSKAVKDIAIRQYAETLKPEWDEMYWRAMLWEAPELFESYLIYLERKREEPERFYLPKREQLNKHGLIQAMQDLEDDKLDLLSISMPPGTQKTTLEKFFCSWIIGKHPKDYSLFFSHSGDITEMFYKGVLDITTNNIEYTWAEIFPKVKLQATNAKAETINFDKYKPYANIQCTSVGSKNAGKVRCNRYLYCDDLIGGIEEALNKNILDKLWRIYSTDARQRKLNEQVKEIHIATRWSVHDVIGRLQRAYEGNDRVRFIAIPDIDPKTGESNFNYKYNGMSVAFFHDQELMMDEVSYKCLYKNEPIEREGLLYHDEDFERYYELPTKEPDAILGICDTKDRGTDFCFLPIFYQYGDKYYWEDCAYDNGAIEIVDELCASVIIKHNPHSVQFESNSAGGRTADAINEKIKGKCRTRITKKFTTQNKETKIIVNSGWVKEHVLIKDKSKYTPKSPYGKAVAALMSYTVAGKNPTDDVPDGMGMFAEYVAKPKTPSAQVINSPF